MAITWNSVPDYDTWGSDSAWNCSQWTEWHKTLKAHFGSQRAKFIWESAYAEGTLGASHTDCRTFNTAFRDYAKKEGLDTYASASFLSPVLNAIGGAKDFATGVTNLFSGKSGKVILYGAVGVVGLVVLYKTYKYATK